MPDVPKLVRARMQVQTPPAEHPDPNVLVAFGENTLSAKERPTVMEHLSRCADCREVIALALPDMPPGVRQPALSRGWFHLPLLRWGTAFAGIVLVSAVGIQLYRSQHGAPRAIARMEASAPTAGQSSTANEGGPGETPAANVPATPGTSGETHSSSPPAQLAAREPAAAKRAASSDADSRWRNSSIGANSGSGAATGGSIGGPTTRGELADATKDQTPGAEEKNYPAKQADAGLLQKPGAVSESVEVRAEAPALETGNAQSQDKSQEYAFQVHGAAPASAPAPEADKVMSRAKAVPAPTVMGRNVASLVLVPRWTIGPSGVLQRSFDEGKTWQAVDVTANPVVANLTDAEVSSSTVEIRADNLNKETGKLKASAKKSDAAGTRAAIFRAVTANGPDVWAGGSGGALYHSLDAGSHWVRVVPTSGSEALTSDIASIQFPDSQHVTVITVTGETWMSQDGGLSWQKR